MKETAWACEGCREILREDGYTVTEKDGPEALDVCPFCGLRTGVKPCRIEKGETDSHASVRTGSE